MRIDPATGRAALNRAEVERLNPSGEAITVARWNRWPTLQGYVVQSAAPKPYRDPLTGEGMFGAAVPRRQLVARTAEHGLVAVWEVDGLSELMNAEVGAPFSVSYLGEGKFKLEVGEPDQEPEQPSPWEERFAAARLVPIPDPALEREAEAEAAMLAAAERLVRRP